MVGLGKILLFGGFFAAAFITVRRPDSAELEWRTVEWGWYALAFAAGVVGVVLLRRAAGQIRTHAHKLEADSRILVTALSTITARLRQLRSEFGGMSVYDVHQWIDRALAEELARFVEARESMVPLFGLQDYASIMTEFAIGERKINRCWSASADGYIDEVDICLARASEHMERAHDLLKACCGRVAPAGESPHPG